MKHTIEFDSTWNYYLIEVTDTNGNQAAFSYYKDEQKLFALDFTFTNGKTCTGKNLKANRTSLSVNERNQIAEVITYVKQIDLSTL